MSEENKTNEITLEVVQEFFETHKEDADVKEFANSFINYDGVENYLNSDDGKKLLQPRLDRHFTKGLDTWKQNNLQTIIDEKINELHPAETEAEKQLRTMQERLNVMETEKNRASIKSTAMLELGEKGLPTSMADFMVSDSLETTRDRINMFEAEYKLAVKGEVEKRLKGTGGTPNHSDDNNSSTDGLTKDKLLKMNYNERLAFYQKNPQLFNQLMNA